MNIIYEELKNAVLSTSKEQWLGIALMISLLSLAATQEPQVTVIAIVTFIGVAKWYYESYESWASKIFVSLTSHFITARIPALVINSVRYLFLNKQNKLLWRDWYAERNRKLQEQMGETS